MIYSVIPPEVIFAEQVQETGRSLREIQWQGIRLEVEVMDEQQVKIVRMHSMNVQDYLRPECAPGQILALSVERLN